MALDVIITAYAVRDGDLTLVNAERLGSSDSWKITAPTVAPDQTKIVASTAEARSLAKTIGDALDTSRTKEMEARAAKDAAAAALGAR